MDFKDIKQIVELMKKTDLTEFEIEHDGLKLKIKRHADATAIGAPAGGTNAPFYIPQADSSAPLQRAVVTPPPQGGGDANDGFIYIKSPMVGTFYRSPSPESPSFVEAGAKVQENTVVCIIEAMKIMNEIQAEVKGTIVECLVESGQPVEFGQRLFKAKPL